MRSQRHFTSQITSKCWIDDLAVCKNSGVGFSTNQVYREDGNPQKDHSFEDRNFHCKFDIDHNSFLYGVFDGHSGNRAVDFCVQRMPAEILLGQLHPKQTDEEIREVLRQAFISVDRSYMDSIGDILAERACYEIPEAITSYEFSKLAHEDREKFEKINYDISSGTTSSIALIYNNKLYVANVGNCRVLLCKTDSNNVLKVLQLSTDHDLKNEDELLRLSLLGINTEVLRTRTQLGNQENTRCIGNYTIKGGYKEVEDLMSAVQEPIIAEPDITGGIQLDDSHQFLLLMSSGLYKSIEDALQTDQVNKFIAQCVAEQFREQATITSVAQAVVDKVVRLHHDWYMMSSCSNNYNIKREDITLVVRNFNYPMPLASKSPSNPGVTFNPLVSGAFITNSQTTLTNSSSTYLYNPTDSNLTDTDSTISSEGVRIESYDPNQRIKPYVNFKDFYDCVRLAKINKTLPDGIDL